MNKFLKEFKDRGYFYQCTDDNELSNLLNKEKIKAYTMQARIDRAESYKGEWSLEPPKETGAGQTAPSQSSGNPRRDLAAFDSRLRYDIRQEERVKAEERVKTESLAEREEENENGVDYTAPGDSSSDVED